MDVTPPTPINSPVSSIVPTMPHRIIAPKIALLNFQTFINRQGRGKARTREVRTLEEKVVGAEYGGLFNFTLIFEP